MELVWYVAFFLNFLAILPRYNFIRTEKILVHIYCESIVCISTRSKRMLKFPYYSVFLLLLFLSRYIIGLTLGPVFLSSSLYLGISTLQRRYQIQILRLSPTLFATLFIFGDFICLCFIGVGGSLAAIFSPQPIGPDLMVVGLAVQVFFTTLFCFLLLIIIKKSFSIVTNEKRTVYIWRK